MIIPVQLDDRILEIFWWFSYRNYVSYYAMSSCTMETVKTNVKQ